MKAFTEMRQQIKENQFKTSHMKDAIYLKVMVFTGRVGIMCMAALCMVSCKREKDNDGSGNSEIRGRVVEEFSDRPVPYAYVGVKMDVFDGFWNSYTLIVDTVQADAHGSFVLDRGRYYELREHYGSVSFFSCADGPDLNGVDVYEDNCAEGGTSLSPDYSQDITVRVYAMGCVRLFVEDEPPLNPEIVYVRIWEPWYWGDVVGMYPLDYDPEQGYRHMVRAYMEYDYKVELITDFGSPETHTELTVKAYPMGLDTTDVYIKY